MRVHAGDLDPLLSIAAAIVDAEGRLVECNAGFQRLTALDPASVAGKRVSRFFLQPTFSSLMAAPVDAQALAHEGLMTMGDPAGRTRTLRGRVWRSAGELRVLAEFDITELEKTSDASLAMNRESGSANLSLARANVSLKQREIRYIEISLTDALTGVGNRHRLELAMAEEIARALRHGVKLSVAMVDVDHFKGVNDHHGHGAGDAVLRRLGVLLREQTRPNDIVARYGGEEFVVLMPHTDLAGAAVVAERIRTALASEVIAPLAEPVTASFGVAELVAGEGGEAFLARADGALYTAKREGRNRVAMAPGAPAP